MVRRQLVQRRGQAGTGGEDVVREGQELVEGDPVDVVEVVLLTGAADEIVEFQDPVPILGKKHSMVIVPFPRPG